MTKQVPDVQDFVQYFQLNKMQCRLLNFPFGIQRRFKLIDLYKSSGATAVSVQGSGYNEEGGNMPFHLIQQLAELVGGISWLYVKFHGVQKRTTSFFRGVGISV